MPLLTDTAYVPAAQASATAISKWKANDTELVVLVLDTAGLEAAHKLGLKAVGWRIETVKLIRAPATVAIQYNTTFTKLHAWRFDQYERELYQDADVLSINSQDDLLRQISPKVELAAVRDTGG